MRSVALIAAVILGSGCIIEAAPSTGGVDLFWSQWWSPSLGSFGDLSATSTEVCGAAAVNEIELTLTDPAGYVRSPDSGPCITSEDIPGVAYRDMEPGTWDYYLAGYRGNVLVFEDWGSFDVFDGRTEEVDALPAAIFYDLRIDYTVEACAPGDSIEFDLYDDDVVAPIYSTYSGAVNPPVAVPCLASSWMIIPSFPGGGYTSSEWIQYDVGGFEVGYSDCAPTWTQSSFGDAISVDVVAAPLGGYCAQ